MLQTRDVPIAEMLSLAPGVDLAHARAHEICGPSRLFLAVLVGAALAGPILWLRPTWTVERLMGDGLRQFLDPGRLIFGSARTAPEILWAAEEALCSGLMPLVVAELAAPPALTPVRRLHLAAEAGATRGAAPLALVLTPDQGGAPGVESRWHIAPAPGWARDRHPRWRLTRARARMAPVQTWEMRLEAGRMRLGPLPG